jgi:urate oxidase
MKKKRTKKTSRTEMLPEYDFRGGARGTYAARYAQGSNVVVLSPDVAKLFPDSESVNRALRACGEIIRTQRRKKVGS